MIIRCSNCNSAYAVNDSKVGNKKFAFNCPNCSAENIIDNRMKIKSVSEESRGKNRGGLASSMQQMKDKSQTGAGLKDFPREEFSGEIPDEQEPINEEVLNYDSASDVPLDDIGTSIYDTPQSGEMQQKSTEEFADSFSDDLKSADSGSGSGDKIEISESDFSEDFDKKNEEFKGIDAEHEELSSDEHLKDEFIETAEESLDLSDAEDLDFSIDDEKNPEKSTEESLDLDLDLSDEDEVESRSEEPIDLDLDFDDSNKKKDEIDANIDIKEIDEELTDFEQPQSKVVQDELEGELELTDELTFDDSKDLDKELTDFEQQQSKVVQDELEGELELTDELTFDDSKDLDKELTDFEQQQSKVVPDELEGELELTDELTLDDSRDFDQQIDAEKNSNDFFMKLDEPEELRGKKKKTPNDRRAPSEKSADLSEDEDDESITIDLDSLDIELEDDDEDTDIMKEIDDISEMPDMSKAIEDKIPAKPLTEEDESTTLDLNSLDIELNEETSVLNGEKLDDFNMDTNESSSINASEKAFISEEEDENITIDLDSLDIPIAETSELKDGELPEEDEKLTLEDAGLTLDELTSEEISSVEQDYNADDDLKLTIDEIDPNLNVHNIQDELLEAEATMPSGPSKKENILKENLVSDEFEDFPDIAFDNDLIEDLPDIHFDEKSIVADKKGKQKQADDDLLDIDIDNDVVYYDNINKVHSRREIIKKVKRGSVNFSIDYSLNYSRFGGLARLFFLFLLTLIPHFIVFSIYHVLSIILGILNNIVVIITGKTVEDFSEIQENTIRYFLSIMASAFGIVEEMPVFAGRQNIDHPLQMNVTYPLRYSRFYALMRLSIIGILILALPHVLILVTMSLLLISVYFAGILSIIITRRWPHFLFDLLTRYFRYVARVLSFIVGLIDAYPPFDFK